MPSTSRPIFVTHLTSPFAASALLVRPQSDLSVAAQRTGIALSLASVVRLDVRYAGREGAYLPSPPAPL
jgi:hypothetical protein